MKTKRIYMNEVDASPGSGAVPPAPAAAPAASTGAPAAEPVVPVSQLKAVIGETFGELKNALFADLRRSGALGKEKPTGETPAAPSATPSAAAPVSAGLTEEALEARLEQERVLTRAQLENKLTDAQLKRMKSALKAEQPPDVAAWTSTYLADMGLVRTSTEPSTPTATAPISPNAAPISDRGSPAPAGAAGWKFELSNPIGMSAAARAQMDAELGAEKARQMRLEAARGQAERMRVSVKP